METCGFLVILWFVSLTFQPSLFSSWCFLRQPICSTHQVPWLEAAELHLDQVSRMLLTLSHLQCHISVAYTVWFGSPHSFLTISNWAGSVFITVAFWFWFYNRVVFSREQRWGSGSLKHIFDREKSVVSATWLSVSRSQTSPSCWLPGNLGLEQSNCGQCFSKPRLGDDLLVEL